MKLKKSLITATLISTISLVGASGLNNTTSNVIKGINYDPASSDYIAAQQASDGGTMRRIIDQNLQTIKRLGFNTIKTFYSEYCPVSGQNCIDVSDEANKYGLKVLLGIYVFSDHLDWSDVQVSEAMTEINSDDPENRTIIGIVIGNEDIYSDDGQPNPTIANYIDTNIKKIQDATNKAVPVLTAQRQNDWETMINANDPYGIIQDSDIIGTNIYPFWGASPEKIKGKSVALTISDNVAELKHKLATTPWKGKPVVVTEEGWASGGTASDRKIYPGMTEEADYYHTWLSRNDSFDSYYFAAFDKNQDSINNPSPAADSEFGLCNSNGTTKDTKIITCQ